MKNLKIIKKHLDQIHGFQPPVNIEDYIRSSSEPQSRLLVLEEDDSLEMAIVLNEQLLKDIEKMETPVNFQIDHISSLSVAIEELSHFNSVYWKAMTAGSVSSLELEVQAEVDKFVALLLWLEEKNEMNLKDKVFEIIFSAPILGEWVLPKQRELYLEANEVAKRICRHMLYLLHHGHFEREKLKDFFRISGSAKLNFSF